MDINNKPKTTNRTDHTANQHQPHAPQQQAATPNFMQQIQPEDQPPVVNFEQRQKELQRTQLIGAGKKFMNIALSIAGAFILALFINRFVFHSFQVIGSSMSPTLEQDDWLVINRLGKSLNNLVGKDFYPARGSVVVFDDPRGSNNEKTLIKRVIALPGERVTLENGNLRVYNNENPQGFDPDIDYKADLHQPTSSRGGIPAEGLVVPEGEIFVSGDNRIPGASEDSRGGLGTVPIEKIVGTLSVRLFPLNKFDISF